MSSSNNTAQYEMPYKLPASTAVLQTTSYVGYRHSSTAQPRMTQIHVQWAEQLFTLHIPTSFWDPDTRTYRPASFADLSATLAEQLGIPTTRNRCGDRALLFKFSPITGDHFNPLDPVHQLAHPDQTLLATAAAGLRRIVAPVRNAAESSDWACPGCNFGNTGWREYCQRCHTARVVSTPCSPHTGHYQLSRLGRHSEEQQSAPHDTVQIYGGMHRSQLMDSGGKEGFQYDAQRGAWVLASVQLRRGQGSLPDPSAAGMVLRAVSGVFEEIDAFKSHCTPGERELLAVCHVGGGGRRSLDCFVSLSSH